MWCFCHQFALPIKKSLAEAGLIAQDFQFMHTFGVYLRSHARTRELLERIRVRRLGPGTELKLLMDRFARWASEWRKLKRFLDLQMDFIILVRTGR